MNTLSLSKTELKLINEVLHYYLNNDVSKENDLRLDCYNRHSRDEVVDIVKLNLQKISAKCKLEI